MTDQFIRIGTTGSMASKADRLKAIAAGQGMPPNPASTVESTTRIYGDLAVTIRLNRGAAGENRQTIVHVKRGGRWLRAGVITTVVVSPSPSPAHGPVPGERKTK